MFGFISYETKYGPSKIYGKQPLKNLKEYDLLKQTDQRYITLVFGGKGICIYCRFEISFYRTSQYITTQRIFLF